MENFIDIAFMLYIRLMPAIYRLRKGKNKKRWMDDSG